MAVQLVTTFKPIVPKYTVTFISSLSCAVPDTKDDVFELDVLQLVWHALRLPQTERACQNEKRSHAGVMLRLVFLPTLTNEVQKERRRHKNQIRMPQKNMSCPVVFSHVRLQRIFENLLSSHKALRFDIAKISFFSVRVLGWDNF